MVISLNEVSELRINDGWGSGICFGINICKNYWVNCTKCYYGKQ